MTTLKVKKIDSSLTNKGFRRMDGDHARYHFYYKGERTSIRTMVSHGEKEIGDPLISRMAKETKLNKNQFTEFINCTLSEAAYIEILRELGEIER